MPRSDLYGTTGTTPSTDEPGQQTDTEFFLQLITAIQLQTMLLETVLVALNAIGAQLGATPTALPDGVHSTSGLQ